MADGPWVQSAQQVPAERRPLQCSCIWNRESRYGGTDITCEFVAECEVHGAQAGGGVPVAGVEETSTPVMASSPSDDGADVPGGTPTGVAALDAATEEPAPSSPIQVTTLRISTRHPESYVLVNESDGSRWRGHAGGSWRWEDARPLALHRERLHTLFEEHGAFTVLCTDPEQEQSRISTRALWWEAAELCDCDPLADYGDDECPHNTIAGWVFPLNRITLPNHTLLTDRYAALSIHVLAEEDDVECHDLHLPPEQLGKITAWMTGQPLPNPSPVLFQPRLLDPIEAAGYRVRPLVGQPRIHAVIHPTAPDLPVGVLMPYTGETGRAAK